uniref:Uncharacterized protein n=1 Tax=Arundo donax TaxID=35708 RepID=A0A0A9AJ30_ARUDO
MNRLINQKITYIGQPLLSNQTVYGS